VEAFVANGYQSNGFACEDQAILFHWACPDCEKTRHLLPEYRRIFHSFEPGGVLIETGRNPPNEVTMNF
jgi:hypothetical protein